MLGGVVLTRFFFVVDGGERALIFNKIRGVQPKVYGEGMHFMIPILMVTLFPRLQLAATKVLRSQNPSIDDPLIYRYQRYVDC